MADFNDFKVALLKGAEALARDCAKKQAKAFAKAAAQYIEATAEEMRDWTAKLKANKLTRADFDDLVRGQQDLFKMRLLTESGIGKVEAEKLRKAFLDLIIDTAVEVWL